MAHIIDIDDYLKLSAPKSVIEEGGVVRLVVMGTQFHIPNALDKAGSYKGFLQYEPTNKVDAEAIKVCLEDGMHLGYVSRKENVVLKEIIGENITRCQIEVFCITQDGKPVDMVAFYSAPICNVNAARVHDGELARIESELKVQREKRLANKLKERKEQREKLDRQKRADLNLDKLSDMTILENKKCYGQLKGLPYIINDDTFFDWHLCKTMLDEDGSMRFSIDEIQYNLKKDDSVAGHYQGYMDLVLYNGKRRWRICLEDGSCVGYIYDEEFQYVDRVILSNRVECTIDIYHVKEKYEFASTLIGYCNVRNIDKSSAGAIDKVLVPIENGIWDDKQKEIYVKFGMKSQKERAGIYYAAQSRKANGVMLEEKEEKEEQPVADFLWFIFKWAMRIVLFPFRLLYWSYQMSEKYGYDFGSSYTKDYKSDHGSSSSGSYDYSRNELHLSSSDKTDWETFEKSIESDEYRDFRW